MSYTLLPYIKLASCIQDNLDSKKYGVSPNFEHRLKYLDDYLKKLGAMTVIVEKGYVDRNFIDDYCGYYARCYQDYPKKCERLHFFNLSFSREDLEGCMLSGDNGDLRKNISLSYLGYIVLRPVMGAPLGRVCLATYPDEAAKARAYPVLKTYYAHLLGFDLEVKTVAFQEQDNAISACATSALWSAFHAIAENPYDRVPSPYTITEHAKRVFPDSISNVVEKGLYPSQMAAAISDEGYTPILCGYISKSYVKALTRAYLNAGVPLILGMSLAWENEDKHQESAVEKFVVGEHAVTVTGYRMADTCLPFSFNQFKEVEKIEPPLYMRSSCIDKFYVHDDQVGPFASMIDRHEYWQKFETRWNYYVDKDDKINASVNTVIIPCNKKIRTRFPYILNIIERCNSLWANFWSNNESRLVWDARLFCVNDFKRAVAQGVLYEDSPKTIREKMLKENMPRYIWVVDACISDKDGLNLKNAFTYLFDATDIDGGNYLICGVYHIADVFTICCNRVRDLKAANKLEDSYSHNFNHIVIKELLKNYWDESHPNLWIAPSK